MANEPKDVISKNKNVEIWRSQQIAGVLMIVFFGTIAISYVIFLNTYVLNKEKDNLINSTWFKSAMVGLTFISSIIMVMIMMNNKDKTSYNAIVWILIGVNVIIFANFFKKMEMKNVIQFNKWNKCIDHFFGYNLFGDVGTCSITFLNTNPPIFSYLSPFLILLFVAISFDIKNIVAQIMNVCIIIALLYENSISNRLNNLFDFNFTTKSFNSIATIVSIISYIILLVIICYKFVSWIGSN